MQYRYRAIYDAYQQYCAGLTSQDVKPFLLALERDGGKIKHFRFPFDPSRREEATFLLERVAKTMLWAYGGFRFYVHGDGEAARRLAEIYSEYGARAFDRAFMENVYRKPFEIVVCRTADEVPAESDAGTPVSAKSEGYRIGFDAGGSDRKVTACIDGKPVFEKEVVWHPKLNADPAYHRAGIRDSIDMALQALGGRVDAIGVSSAGIIVDDEVRVASLFIKVPQEIYAEQVFPIYKDLAKTYHCPVKVANDGDVAALAGAFDLGQGAVMGIAMGTSLAGGYIAPDRTIKGYLNELAFVPVDAGEGAPVDDWSGDVGVGVCYHSQDGVNRLAAERGIDFGTAATPAEKLKVVQALANNGDPVAEKIFCDLGHYFGKTLLWFGMFYDIEKAVFLGRVASGRGGELLLEAAQNVLGQARSKIEIVLPDEMSRRLGQSYTATLL